MYTKLQSHLIDRWVAQMSPEQFRHRLTCQLYFPHDSETKTALYFRSWMRRYFEDGCYRVVEDAYPGQTVGSVRDAMFEENAEAETQEWDGIGGYNYHMFRHLKFGNRYDRLMVNYRPLLIPAMQILARKPISAVIEIGTGTGFVTYLLSRTSNRAKFFGYDICNLLDRPRELFHPDFKGKFISAYTDEALKEIDPDVPEDGTVLFLTYGTFHNIAPDIAKSIMESFTSFRDKVYVLSTETQDPNYAPDTQKDHVRAEFSDEPLFGKMPIYSHNYPRLFDDQPFDDVRYYSAPMPKDIGRKPSFNRVITTVGCKGVDLRLEPSEGNGLISLF